MSTFTSQARQVGELGLARRMGGTSSERFSTSLSNRTELWTPRVISTARPTSTRSSPVLQLHQRRRRRHSSWPSYGRIADPLRSSFPARAFRERTGRHCGGRLVHDRSVCGRPLQLRAALGPRRYRSGCIYHRRKSAQDETRAGLRGEIVLRDPCAQHDQGGLSVGLRLQIAVSDVSDSLSLGGLVWRDLRWGRGVQDGWADQAGNAAVEVFASPDLIVGNADDYSPCGHHGGGSAASTSAGFRPASTTTCSSARQQAGRSRFRREVTNGSTATRTRRGLTAMFVLAAGQDQLAFDAGILGSAPSFGVTRWIRRMGRRFR